MGDHPAPAFVEPMLLTAGTDLPTGKTWYAQLKMDGARGQLRTVDRFATLRTRCGRLFDSEFPEIIQAAASLPDTVLDGEIVVLDQDGTPDFAALRSRLGADPRRSRPAVARQAVFFAFDVIWHQGTDLRGCPLSRRRQVLESLPPSGAVSRVDTYPGQAAAVLDFAREHQLEGAVVKRADSLYQSCRSTAWLKFKIRRTERYWVTAWRPGNPGELDQYWVGRVVNGVLTSTGEVSYGLKPGQAAALRPILHAAALGDRGRNGLIPVAPVVAMTGESHGKDTAWLRDPIISSVHIEPSGP